MFRDLKSSVASWSRARRIVWAGAASIMALPLAVATAGVAASTPAAAALRLPAVPPAGKAYLGAWVQPDSTSRSPLANQFELAQLGNFQGILGRPLAIVHVYQGWKFPAKIATVSALAGSGAIPMIDWEHGDTLIHIAEGRDDANLIVPYAKELKAYGKPVFLRWSWEPNVGHTVTPTFAQQYVAAWQHIVNVFRGPGGVGATNVAFVWNPGIAGSTFPHLLQSLYPGSSYVDWIGIDGYSRAGTSPPNQSFTQMFGKVYTTLTSASYGGKPIIIPETGSSGATNQVPFLQSVVSALQSGQFPLVKGFAYYDGTNDNLGNNGAWTLVGAGLDQFANMARGSLFSPMG